MIESKTFLNRPEEAVDFYNTLGEDLLRIISDFFNVYNDDTGESVSQNIIIVVYRKQLQGEKECILPS